MSTNETEIAIITDAESDGSQAIEIRSAFDIAPGKFKQGLKRRGTNRTTLMEWLRTELKDGIDWGRIHVVKKEICPKGKHCDNPYHFSKPSLWKSGAEKLAGMMGLRSTWPNLDAELESIRSGSKVILLKCQLLDMRGNPVSEGVGARNLDQDSGDPNKALKMAKKSSLIDAVLNAGGLSEVFTQDVEDMNPAHFPDEPVADPYQQGEDRVDGAFPKHSSKPVATHCPIGREWKGTPWGEVDDGFLNWICSNIDDKPDLVAAARKELDGRTVESQEATHKRFEQRTNPVGKRMADYAREITMCKKLDELTVIKDELPEEFEPGLRKYIATRESELLVN